MTMKTVSAMILIDTSTALTWRAFDVPITSSQVISRRDQERQQVERAAGVGAGRAIGQGQRAGLDQPNRSVCASKPFM